MHHCILSKGTWLRLPTIFAAPKSLDMISLFSFSIRLLHLAFELRCVRLKDRYASRLDSIYHTPAMILFRVTCLFCLAIWNSPDHGLVAGCTGSWERYSISILGKHAKAKCSLRFIRHWEANNVVCAVLMSQILEEFSASASTYRCLSTVYRTPFACL